MILRSMALAAVLALTATFALGATGAQAAGDPVKGKTTFSQQCMLCHSTTAGQEGAGPNLGAVVGRKAAADPGFPGYSRALKGSGVVWTPANLDKFLSGPTKMVPGTAMPITLGQPQDRLNVIAYLASLKKSH